MEKTSVAVAGDYVRGVDDLTLARIGRLAGAIAVVFAVLCGNSLAAPPVPTAAEFIPDPASVTRHGPAWRYPQAGWHVVHISGEPYERGFQHGKLLSAEIVAYITDLAAIRSPKSPHDAWRDKRTLANALFLRRFDVEYLEEMKGIADGAAAAGAEYDGRRLDLVDIVAINSDVEVGFLEGGLEASATGLDRRKFTGPQYSQPKADVPERCSAFLATGPATADGHIVVGHITMSDLEFVRHYNVWLDVAPAEGRRVVMQTFPGGIFSGMDYHINDGGLILAETTIRQTKFNPAGKSLASRTRRAVQYAETIDRAVEILGDSSNGLYTNQWLLGDLKSDEIAMFELGTDRSRLWRSSRNEWFAGTTGFYWGCNNSRDLDVLKETVPDLAGKPANLVEFPRARDAAWLALFRRHAGRIGEAFAFEAYGSAPLAAFPSCDAKFATAQMARRLESWALFGPPRGRTWDASAHDRKKYPNVQPLVSNDWTVLRVDAPPADSSQVAAVDLAPFPNEEKSSHVKFEAQHPFAWRGTLLAQTDADIWLAAGFAEYEKVVAFEQALHRRGAEKPAESKSIEKEARDLVDLALFEHESKWRTAALRLGRDVPLLETSSDPAQHDWYDIAKGKVVLLLAALRAKLGGEACDRILDAFGQAHAGQRVTTAQFVDHCRQSGGAPAVEILEAWLHPEKSEPPVAGNLWTIYSFEAEPEQALIVYGTFADRAANREAAELLARALARRFNNFAYAIKADDAVDEEELSRRHVLLVGRPAANRVAARLVAKLPVSFGPGSFRVRGETYAHPASSIVAAGENPLNSRFSVVLYAGLGAESTWRCVQHQETEEHPQPQVLLHAHGRKAARFRVSTDAAR
ncbi:MAG: hypothetical protein HY290_21040 [Planctomycetia bacterium]|nr:hypothetical protein [Planctomycetia bacterium]